MSRILIALIAASLLTANSQATLISENLGAGAYSASGQYGNLAPANAFDGNNGSVWNAGGFAGHWVEVDLGQSYSLETFSLIANQSPNGNTVHEIWLSSMSMHWNLGNATLAHTFSGYTLNGDVLNATLSSPMMAQYVQFRTTYTPSWVSWREIQVFSAAAAVPEPATLGLVFIGFAGLAMARRKTT